MSHANDDYREVAFQNDWANPRPSEGMERLVSLVARNTPCPHGSDIGTCDCGAEMRKALRFMTQEAPAGFVLLVLIDMMHRRALSPYDVCQGSANETLHGIIKSVESAILAKANR